jgi:hypothetical protein
MMALGAAGWWYNWHLASARGEFSIKLCVFVPLALAGGLLLAVRPDWAGPWRADSTRSRKIAMIAVIVVMAVGSAIEFFSLRQVLEQRAPRQKVIAWSPEMGTPTIPVSLAARTRQPEPEPPAIDFLGRPYRLGAFNQRPHGMWEFVTAGETVANWTTLLTLIDRPDARTRADLDRLAEGILDAYRSRGAKILMAKTMGQTPESVYNYAVAAFDETQEQRYE